MNSTGTREGPTTESSGRSAIPGPARRRRILGLIGSAVLVAVMAVAFLFQDGVASFGRSLMNLFSSPGQAPTGLAAAPTVNPSQPLTRAEAIDRIDAASPVFGLYTPDSPTDRAEITAAETAAGTDAGIVTYFADASHPLDVGLLDAAAADGAVPMVSLEATTWSTADIAAGKYDDEIRRQAEKLGEVNGGDGGVVLVRLNHEMNGDWYPWSEARQGNAPGDYAASWKRFVEVVRDTGTGNTTVLWVWSPNILRGAELSTMVDAYPGDDYVDYIGLTGYGNTTYEREASQTFDDSIAAIRSDVSADKPLIITESGASPGKYQTAWTSSLGSWLEANEDVQAFVWFDFDKTEGASTDWRFTTKPLVADALRQSLSDAGATPLAAS